MLFTKITSLIWASIIIIIIIILLKFDRIPGLWMASFDLSRLLHLRNIPSYVSHSCPSSWCDTTKRLQYLSQSVWVHSPLSLFFLPVLGRGLVWNAMALQRSWNMHVTIKGEGVRKMSSQIRSRCNSWCNVEDFFICHWYRYTECEMILGNFPLTCNVTKTILK